MQKDNQILDNQNGAIDTLSDMSFIQNNELGKLCKRSAKIAKAVYLVLAHIDTNNNLRFRAEESAIGLSDTTLSLIYKTSTDQEKSVQVIIANALSLINMVEILNSIQKVSDTNAEILIQQTNKFLSEIGRYAQLSKKTPALVFDFSDEGSEQSAEDMSALPDNSLHNPSKNTQDNQIRSVSNLSSKKDSKVIEVISRASSRTEDTTVRIARSSFHPSNAEFRQRLANAKTIEDLHGITQTPTRIGQNDQVSNVVGAGQYKNERQQLIVKTIATKGELSIKDLEGVVKGCSEKTIQRELLTLVDQGILLKTGERRWSRYSLAN
jgi:hypothetical protein